jgi:hypothetical protein
MRAGEVLSAITPNLHHAITPLERLEPADQLPPPNKDSDKELSIYEGGAAGANVLGLEMG